MPKISVIVPVYRAEQYIERCARSLFEQSLDDLEYLFIDDCSPDHSVEVLQRVLDDYPNRKAQVVIHRMETNSGVSAVRTWGIKHATGDYITHCDSDDWIDLDMYRVMYDQAIRNDADVVVCDYYITDGNSTMNTIKGCGNTNKEQFIERILLQIDPWPVWNKIFKKESCHKENIVFPKGNMGEDMLLTLQFLLNCEKIIYVQQPFYNYFLNPLSITHVKNSEKVLENFEQLKINADILFEIFNRLGKYEEYKEQLMTLKWMVRNTIWNLVSDDLVFKKWKSTYPELNEQVLWNKYIPAKEKVRYVLTLLRIYPQNRR